MYKRCALQRIPRDVERAAGHDYGSALDDGVSSVDLIVFKSFRGKFSIVDLHGLSQLTFLLDLFSEKV